MSLCEQVGIEDCLDLQEEGDQLSQESLESLLTALHAQFSQAAPQPTSRTVFSTLIGRELHSVAPPALLCHKEPARASKAPY